MTEKTNKPEEELKKTVEAQGTVSEKAVAEKAKDAEKVSEEMIKTENEKEEVETEAEKKKKIAEKEVKEKVDEKSDNVRGKPFKRKSREERDAEDRQQHLLKWDPKTKLGRDVKEGKVKDFDQILEEKKKILEDEVIDLLLNVKSDLISVGQSKGKFGGGKRRAWRQTQKKTKEGNVPTFSAYAVAGDGEGHIGVGQGEAQETLPARDKAIRKAKLNIKKINRGCASFDCSCSEPHTVPFKVTGKCGSVKLTLIPAPQGTGLVVGGELKKILQLAGIKDIYSKSEGKTRTTFNLIKACMNALEKTNDDNLKIKKVDGGEE